jgi:hypothetical protein
MERKSMLKRVLSFVLLITIFSSFTAPAMAHTKVPEETQLPPINVEELNEAGLDGELIMKILLIRYHILYDENDNLCTDLTVEQLVNDYGFTQQQLDDLQAIFNGTYVALGYRAPADRELANKPLSQKTMAKRFYISNDDLAHGSGAILCAAAAVGPEALQVAFTFYATLIGGPVGTAIAGVIDVLGAAFFIDFAFKIVGAVAQDKGLAFYFDYGFPPITIEIE